MKNIIIYGAGHMGQLYLSHLDDDTKCVAFVDGDPVKQGKTYFGIPIIPPQKIIGLEFDKVVICVNAHSVHSISFGWKYEEEMLQVLDELGIPEEKITLQCNRVESNIKPFKFVSELSEIMKNRNVPGAVAECGVWRGHFAHHINKCFPERKLYLFDTFKGFDENDWGKDADGEFGEYVIANQDDYHFYRGSERAALLRCIHRNNVVIKKGYVPDTFAGLENEHFAYVNLDMDLYAPQLAALRFFGPRMSVGGVITVHDYTTLPGTNQAVTEFAEESGAVVLPVIEDSSVAIVMR